MVRIGGRGLAQGTHSETNSLIGSIGGASGPAFFVYKPPHTRLHSVCGYYERTQGAPYIFTATHAAYKSRGIRPRPLAFVHSSYVVGKPLANKSLEDKRKGSWPAAHRRLPAGVFIYLWNNVPLPVSTPETPSEPSPEPPPPGPTIEERIAELLNKNKR